MRRMTIFRSDAALMAAALLLAAPAATASAQRPDAPQPAVEQARRPTTTLPATHLVQQGETLWDLAARYLGDPLLWPEIYRLNTDVIEDPHWIYPGEELRLVPAAEPSAPVTATVEPRPMERIPATEETIFSPRQTTVAPTTTLQLREQQAYRAVREGEFFSSGFLTEGADLPTGRLVGSAEPLSVRQAAARTNAGLNQRMVVTPPAGDSLSRGDLLLAVRRQGEVRGYGEIVRPTGLLRVDGDDGRGHTIATIVSQYDRIVTGQELLKVAPFSFTRSDRPAPVATGISGTVLAVRDAGNLVAMQNVLFVDKGAEDGVRLGDVFAISSSTRSDDSGTEMDQALALVVNTRARTSSLLIVELYRPDIRAGSIARLVRRIPS